MTCFCLFFLIRWVVLEGKAGRTPQFSVLKELPCQDDKDPWVRVYDPRLSAKATNQWYLHNFRQNRRSKALVP